MRKFLLIILFTTSIFANAQHDDKTTEDNNNLPIINDLENMIETLSEENEDVFDYSELIDELNYYSINKMNLNNPDYSALKNIFGLNDYQLYHLQRYLATYGKMLSIYELSLIEGMDTASVQRLIKYVDVYPIEKQQNESEQSRLFRINKCFWLE